MGGDNEGRQCGVTDSSAKQIIDACVSIFRSQNQGILDEPVVLPHKFSFRVTPKQATVEPDATSAKNDLDAHEDKGDEAEFLQWYEHCFGAQRSFVRTPCHDLKCELSLIILLATIAV